MIRDQEIERLINYARGLGLTVKFSKTLNDSASWTLDGTELTISTHPKHNRTKIETVLSFIHELGHMLYFIHEKDRKLDLKFDEAVERQNLVDEDIDETPIPKHLRKKILDVEVKSAEWWNVIYKETNCKFPLWKLEMAKCFDIWQYEVYYETGYFPTRKERIQKGKELSLQFKNQ